MTRRAFTFVGMKKQFVVIVWHQARNRDENQRYHLWRDKNDDARIFESKSQAREAWTSSGMAKNHFGTIVEVTPNECAWI